jgi:hypothetical protein
VYKKNLDNKAKKLPNHNYFRDFKLMFQVWAKEIDEGRVPEDIQTILEDVGALKKEK